MNERTASTLRTKGFEIRKDGVLKTPHNLRQGYFLNDENEKTIQISNLQIPENDVLVEETKSTTSNNSGKSDRSRSITPTGDTSRKGSTSSLLRIEINSPSPERAASPSEGPSSGEFGIRFNQMNEFVRFGHVGNGASASVAKCIRFNGEEIGIYALKVCNFE